jgi:hypothetical protein
MLRVYFAAASAAAFLCVAGCAINISDLVPTATLVVVPGPNGESYLIQTCGPASIDNFAALPGQIENAGNNLPPEVGRNTVVQAVVAHSQYVADQSLRAANAILATPNPTVAAAPPVPKPTMGLAAPHFQDFATMVSEKILRHTSGTPTTSLNQAETDFWAMALQYFYKYYRGSFTPYMGATLATPTLSSSSSASTAYTVSDTEIVNAVSVFVEFLLDDIFHSPIWTVTSKGKSTYYPSGSATAPTALTLNNLQSLGTLSSGLSGCGMNIPKANFVRILANAFSDAATTDAGLVVKSAGGIEVGLGILGKVSIGDNKTLTDLVQMAVSEVIARLTVAFAVPIVSSIDISKQSGSSAVPKSSSAYAASSLSRLFVSAKGS